MRVWYFEWFEVRKKSLMRFMGIFGLTWLLFCCFGFVLSSGTIAFPLKEHAVELSKQWEGALIDMFRLDIPSVSEEEFEKKFRDFALSLDTSRELRLRTLYHKNRAIFQKYGRLRDHVVSIIDNVPTEELRNLIAKELERINHASTVVEMIFVVMWIRCRCIVGLAPDANVVDMIFDVSCIMKERMFFDSFGQVGGNWMRISRYRPFFEENVGLERFGMDNEVRQEDFEDISKCLRQFYTQFNQNIGRYMQTWFKNNPEALLKFMETIRATGFDRTMVSAGMKLSCVGREKLMQILLASRDVERIYPSEMCKNGEGYFRWANIVNKFYLGFPELPDVVFSKVDQRCVISLHEGHGKEFRRMFDYHFYALNDYLMPHGGTGYVEWIVGMLEYLKRHENDEVNGLAEEDVDCNRYGKLFELMTVWYWYAMPISEIEYERDLRRIFCFIKELVFFYACYVCDTKEEGRTQIFQDMHREYRGVFRLTIVPSGDFNFKEGRSRDLVEGIPLEVANGLMIDNVARYFGAWFGLRKMRIEWLEKHFKDHTLVLDFTEDGVVSIDAMYMLFKQLEWIQDVVIGDDVAAEDLLPTVVAVNPLDVVRIVVKSPTMVDETDMRGEGFHHDTDAETESTDPHGLGHIREPNITPRPVEFPLDSGVREELVDGDIVAVIRSLVVLAVPCVSLFGTYYYVFGNVLIVSGYIRFISLLSFLGLFCVIYSMIRGYILDASDGGDIFTNVEEAISMEMGVVFVLIHAILDTRREKNVEIDVGNADRTEMPVHSESVLDKVVEEKIDEVEDEDDEWFWWWIVGSVVIVTGVAVGMVVLWVVRESVV